MSNAVQATHVSRILPRLVAIAFLGAVIVLGIASWDVARGRVPDTRSPLLLDALNSPENRTCTRELPELAVKYMPAGLSEAALRTLLASATVEAPRPWFWTPKSDDAIMPPTADGTLNFARTLRFTPFGNHQLKGSATIRDGVVTDARLSVICALG